MEGLRVVIVDDHPVFRHGLRMLLEDLGVDVVAEESDGAAGVAAVLAHEGARASRRSQANRPASTGRNVATRAVAERLS